MTEEQSLHVAKANSIISKIQSPFFSIFQYWSDAYPSVTWNMTAFSIWCRSHEQQVHFGWTPDHLVLPQKQPLLIGWESHWGGYWLQKRSQRADSRWSSMAQTLRESARRNSFGCTLLKILLRSTTALIKKAQQHHDREATSPPSNLITFYRWNNESIHVYLHVFLCLVCKSHSYC